MEYRKPKFYPQSAEAANIIGQKFNLVYDNTREDYDFFDAITTENISEYIAYYETLGHESDDIKNIFGALFISFLFANQDDLTMLNQFWSDIKNKILHKDYHIHEYIIYHNTYLNLGEDYKYNSIAIALQELFEDRYLRSVTYTFEPYINANLGYDAYKITFSEDETGILGYFEVHKTRDDDSVWYRHDFEVPIEKWQQIVEETAKIGVPLTINYYYGDFEVYNGCRLELYNYKEGLFYKINWQEKTQYPDHLKQALILKDCILETVDVEKIAKILLSNTENYCYEIMSPIQHICESSAAWDGEFKFLREVTETRFAFTMGTSTNYRSIYEIKLPRLSEYSSLGQLVKKFDFGFEERVILALAMAVHLRPQALDKFFTRNEEIDRTFSQAGGLKGRFHSGYIPTLETATFLLAGADISKRIMILQLFEEDSIFTKNNIIKLEVKEPTEPKYAGQLVISDEYLEYLTTAKAFKPSYVNNFPAEVLTTELEWEDLYLEKETISEINNIETWLNNQHKIMYELKLRKHLKLGYRALFYGSSVTGKTLTATLLGKNLGLEVYRVDLSMITSKYIGETTKNLARLFDMAENKNWILFFDEAESLFGKRSTDVQRATDSYYNQEVGYLLQRIENYDGLVILATNLLDNIDTAFMRRFQSLVYFPVPSATQQLALWKNIFANGLKLAKNVNLKMLSEKYILTASNITNILRDVTIKTLQAKSSQISMQTLTEATERELKKANLRQSVGFKK